MHEIIAVPSSNDDSSGRRIPIVRLRPPESAFVKVRRLTTVWRERSHSKARLYTVVTQIIGGAVCMRSCSDIYVDNFERVGHCSVNNERSGQFLSFRRANEQIRCPLGGANTDGHGSGQVKLRAVTGALGNEAIRSFPLRVRTGRCAGKPYYLCVHGGYYTIKVHSSILFMNVWISRTRRHDVNVAITGASAFTHLTNPKSAGRTAASKTPLRHHRRVACTDTNNTVFNDDTGRTRVTDIYTDRGFPRFPDRLCLMVAGCLAASIRNFNCMLTSYLF